MIQIRWPELENYIKNHYLLMLDWPDLLNHFMSIIEFTQKKFPEAKESSDVDKKFEQFL